MNNCAERCNCLPDDPGIMQPGYAAGRRHDNAGDLDAARLLLSWLKEGRAVCHPRFCDGEFHCAMHLNKRSGHQPYVKDMGVEVEATLPEIARSARQINQATTARVLVGGEWEYDPTVWQWLVQRDLPERLPWCPAQILVQGIYDGTTLAILQHVKAYAGPKYLVANAGVLEAVSKSLGLQGVPVDYHGCHQQMAGIQQRLQVELTAGAMVLWCAGVAGKRPLWHLFCDCPGTTHLDFGHLFDYLAGDCSRSWLTCDNPRRQLSINTIVPWLRNGGQ